MVMPMNKPMSSTPKHAIEIHSATVSLPPSTARAPPEVLRRARGPARAPCEVLASGCLAEGGPEVATAG